jgi:hypothetical protein
VATRDGKPVLRVYIAGPINGKPDGNRPAFSEAAERIRRAGHQPLNPWDVPPDHDGRCCPGEPVEHDPDSGHTYGCYLRADIIWLMFCDAIMFLADWEQSKGASTEAHVAKSIGLPVVEF